MSRCKRKSLRADPSFGLLTADLQRRFSCTCKASSGAQVQDASYLGHLEIPAAAAVTGAAIFVRVSNFGRLALLGVDRPGVYDDTETLDRIAGVDLDRILAAVTAYGYTPLLEDVLSQEYDGASDALRAAYPSQPPTWFIRFFDYL